MSDLVEQLRALNDGVSRPVTILEREVCGKAADRIEALEAEIKEWRMIVENLESQIKADRVTGATSLVDEAACLIWSELCPDMVMGDEDRPYYEAAAKAVLALSPSRGEIIEECAKLCEGLRHVDYPSETSEWSSGTFDCAQAVRSLGMDNAAFKNTDGSPAIAVLAAVRHCANSWEGSARLLGNIRAVDISRACSEAIAALNQQLRDERK
jgi:hypothetical protein